MHLFVSAGEPSGDLHAANLSSEFYRQEPNANIVGYGGERLSASGAKLLYPLTELAVMWFGRAMLHLPKFFQLARKAENYFHYQKPDALVVIDYPGFHWAMAKRAHRAGVPVYYFVPPQLWAWAGWRSEKMRKWVRVVLTAMPFEDDWYRERGVNTHYVGHPYFDELAEQKLDRSFVAMKKAEPGRIVALLPGSRTQEVTGNFRLMAAAAKIVHDKESDVRFLVAAFSDKHANLIRQELAGSRLPVEIHVGRTPEIIELADAALAVSGSVSLELMYRGTPSVIVYKISPLARAVSRQFITCPYISLVNMLAGEELFPEYLLTSFEPELLAAPIIVWLRQADIAEHLKSQLAGLRQRVAVPGACQRAVKFIRDDLSR